MPKLVAAYMHTGQWGLPFAEARLQIILLFARPLVSQRDATGMLIEIYGFESDSAFENNLIDSEAGERGP